MTELNIALHRKQLDALEVLSKPEVKVLGYGGARGGGKSHLVRAYCVIRALKYPKSKHLIVRRTYPELFRTHVLRLQQDYGQILSHQERFHRFTLENGSCVEYGFCESDKDLNRWQGSEYETVCIDEAQFFPWSQIDYFKTVSRTTIPGLRCKRLVTFNPGGLSHSALKQRFIQRQFPSNEDPQDYDFVKSLVQDNPSLATDYIKQLEQLPEQLRKAYLLGDFDALIGSFFSINPNVFEDPFEISDPDLHSRLYGSLDYGVAHGTSFAMLYLDPKGRVHRLWHYLNSELTADANASEIRDRMNTFPHTKGMPPVKVFADSSMWGEQRISANTYFQAIDVFKKSLPQSIEWVPATKEKIWSSQILRGMLDPPAGQAPTYCVWRPYNPIWLESMNTVEIDTARPETYVKAEGDDVADETRYGAAGLFSEYHQGVLADDLKRKASLAIANRPKTDWYTL